MSLKRDKQKPTGEHFKAKLQNTRARKSVTSQRDNAGCWGTLS